jgi:hypothetical protein
VVNMSDGLFMDSRMKHRAAGAPPLPSLLRYPASHRAYLLAVHCCCRREASNSASVRCGKNTLHAAEKRGVGLFEGRRLTPETLITMRGENRKTISRCQTPAGLDPQSC